MKHAAARGAAVELPASLLRLHRHGLSPLLVTGGTHDERVAIALRFHRASPIAREPFLALDCAREEQSLERALECWLLEPGLVPHGEAGLSAVTLFLDPLSALGPGTQRLLLMLAHRLQRLDGAAPPAGPRRIMAGDRFPLARGAKAHVTCAALVDHFDKIRIELNAPGRRGVA